MPPRSTGRPKTSLLRASQTLTKREVRELATPVLNHTTEIYTKVVNKNLVDAVKLLSRKGLPDVTPRSHVTGPSSWPPTSVDN
jgi:hypothetical protein